MVLSVKERCHFVFVNLLPVISHFYGFWLCLSQANVREAENSCEVSAQAIELSAKIADFR